MTKRILTMLLALLICLTACKKPLTWQEQYDLGMRYISEGNYKEAIIAFTAAIELDPAQMDAYVALVNSYTNIGDFDGALSIIERARPVAAEQDLFDWMVNAVNYIQERYGTIDDADRIVFTFYQNGYFYYGQMVDGKRSGSGIWGRIENDMETYLYEGDWRDDMPNGNGKITKDKDLHKIAMESGHTYAVHTETVGNFKNGLYQGTIQETWKMNNGDNHKWVYETIDGIPQSIQVSENISERPYYSDRIAKGDYIMAFDQLNESTELWSSGNIYKVAGLDYD